MMASFKHHLDASAVLPCSKKRREMMNTEEVVVPLIGKGFSELPNDVLSVIIRKLFSPSDLVWFGAVCVNWRYALIQNPNKHFKFPSSLPVLLLPSPSSSSTDEEHKENITTTRTGIRLSSLYKGKIHDFPLPISGNFCGSSHGWLVVATGSNHNYSVKLLNPFISFNNEIELPSATNLKQDPNNYNDEEDCLGKVVLSASPSSSSSNGGTGEVVVMAIHGKYSTLSYCRLGDNAWTALPFEWIKQVADVMYCKGLFYAILYDGLVFTIEIPVASTLDITRKINVIAHPRRRPPQVAEYCRGGSHYFTDNYLVESSGEILQVIMEKRLIREGCSVHYRTLGFHVYKLAKVVDGHVQSNCSKTTNIDNNEKYQWEETWSLDGISLFISFKVSISLSASDFPGCKPNCIYFSENYEKPRHGRRDWVGTPNIEIYDLEDMIFHEKSHLTRYGFSPPCSYPIWIQPKL